MALAQIPLAQNGGVPCHRIMACTHSRDPAQCGSQLGNEQEPHKENRWASTLEQFVVGHPRARLLLHGCMVAFYLALILILPWLPRSPESASPWHDFGRFSQFVIWCVWWPFVVLSMLGVGRLWCGLFCPEGALAAWASRYGGNRSVPRWMRWGAIPLLAFVAITILGQLFEVDEAPLTQLVILGGSTLLAIVVGLIFAKRTWVWCRYLCPVSLLFGVFSRANAS